MYRRGAQGRHHGKARGRIGDSKRSVMEQRWVHVRGIKDISREVVVLG